MKRTALAVLLPVVLCVACGGPRVTLPPPAPAPAGPPGGLRFFTLQRPGTPSSLARSLFRDESWRRALALANGLGDDVPLAAGDRLLLPAGAPPYGQHGDLLLAHTRVEEGEEALIAYDRGTVLARDGRDAEALAHFRRAVLLAPGMTEARYNLGVSLLRAAGDSRTAAEEAVESLGWAAYLRPGRAEYRFAHGVALVRAQRFAEAETELRAAVTVDPSHAEGRFTLARLYQRMGRTEDERREWRRYLELDEQGPWADEARRRLHELDAPSSSP